MTADRFLDNAIEAATLADAYREIYRIVRKAGYRTNPEIWRQARRCKDVADKNWHAFDVTWGVPPRS